MFDDVTKKEGMVASHFAPIESIEEAKNSIAAVCKIFLVLAAIMGVVSFFIFKAGILDAALYILLALIIWKFQSRVAAIILLLLTILQVVVTVMNLMGVADLGGRNVVLSIIVALAAARVVQATFR